MKIVENKSGLGKRLTQARKNAGLKQAELAEKLGVYQSNISGWEVDRTRPDIDDLRKLSDALKVPAEWIMYGKSAQMDSIDLKMILDNPDNRPVYNGKELSDLQIEMVEKILG
jgi:transcriptional regulator with XRE-family HTH domain